MEIVEDYGCSQFRHTLAQMQIWLITQAPVYNEYEVVGN